MYRTNTCGELRISDAGKKTTLAGWVQRIRKMGGMTFVDLRDRYGITQLVFNSETDSDLFEAANKLGREFVIQITGTVEERSNKNPHLPTGDIEIIVSELNVLNKSDVPPFTIEDETDGGDDLRMKYRYLDYGVLLCAKTSNCATEWHLKSAAILTAKDFLRSKRLCLLNLRLKEREIS